MPSPILATKLYIPQPRTNIVPRSRLIDQLNNGLGHKLSLISAPAGFGKTTLVSEWVAGCKRPVAWLSLDEEDNDTTRFLTYLITALQTIVPNIGAEVLRTVQSAQLPPIESILTILLNEIATIPDSIILILDDYHMVDSKGIDNALSFLLHSIIKTVSSAENKSEASCLFAIQ
jgi:LuxR family maltose regulon positive regulatory protein